ncbi:Protein Hook 1 [Clonorchis sinensis]|uniref:Protein Hook 1 n=1 Tax=Clonorchis sinensis TaxID=79923 RepID=A0A8T1N0J6_CLOSI|nr:Protein Hook 1 [Clonorchis sinensis]
MSGGHAVQNLLRWLRTFDAASSVESVSDMADGVILGKVLLAISPKHFSLEWLGQLRTGGHITPSIKVKNLEHIVCAVEAFLAQVPDESILVRPLPNLVSIAEYNAEDEAFRLLQLVLGCAVNCENKSTYIEAIMHLEESVQHVLMEAIQQLMTSSVRLNTAVSDAFQNSGDSQLISAVDECKRLSFQKEALTQQCHELEKLVETLRGENTSLQLELEQARCAQNQTIMDSTEHDISANLLLSSAETGLPGTAAEIPMSPTVASVRIGQLRDQLTKLRNELYRVETEKEEVKIKLADSQTTVEGLRQKCDLLMRKSEEAVHLKDELDIAREELAAASHLTTTMDQLRKRADEAVELRVRCAKLETDNKVLVDRLAELEQETRLTGHVRSQAETQRLQAADARQAATQANARADAIEAELRRVRDELSATMREKTRLVTELNRLRSCCEQLQRCAPPASALNEELTTVEPDANGMMYTPAMQSQMLTLREELTRLRTSLSSLEIAASTSVADEDHHSLSEHDGSRVMQTSDFPDNSSNLMDNDRHGTSDGTSSPLHMSATKSEDFDGHLVASLRGQLDEKDRAYESMEQQYRGYLWKARSLIRSLQRQLRKQDENAGVANEGSNDVARLRALLVEKERIIENLERHLEQTRLRRDAEERILLAAWYNRGVRQTRELVEQRIRDQQTQPGPPGTQPKTAADDATTGAEEMSFLERQREIHLKPPRGLTSVVVASK